MEEKKTVVEIKEKEGISLSLENKTINIGIKNYSNKNLLDNWDFRNPVNQFNKTYFDRTESDINNELYPDRYIIDRWFNYKINNTGREYIQYTNKGLFFHGYSGGNFYIQQYLNYDLVNQLEGKTITFSCLISKDMDSEPILLKVTGIVNKGSEDGAITNIIHENMYNGWGLQVYIHKPLKCEVSIFNNGVEANHSGVLIAAKLEIGRESTLVDENNQIRDIFNQEEEKLKCYRCLQVYIVRTNAQVYLPVACAWLTNQLKTKHDFIVPMKNPVVHYYQATSHGMDWFIGGIWSDGNRERKTMNKDTYNINFSIWSYTDKDCILDVIWDKDNENWINLGHTFVLNGLYQPILNCGNGNGYYFTGDF